jgi:hypothetical protein
VEYYSTTKQNKDECYKLDEPWKHFAKWEKLGIKVYILYDAFYTKYPQ